MASKFPQAANLLNDEVDYELRLRNYGEECSNSLESKRRLLRRLFRKDAKENREYRSVYSIVEESEVIAGRIDEISRGLAQGYDEKLVSRLKHYYLRVKRSNAQIEEEETTRNVWTNRIQALLTANCSLIDENQKHQSVSGSSDHESVDFDISDTEIGATALTGKKKAKESKKGPEKGDDRARLELKVQGLEVQMAELKTMLQQVLKQQSQRDQLPNQPSKTGQASRTGTIPKGSRSQALAPQEGNSVENPEGQLRGYHPQSGGLFSVNNPENNSGWNSLGQRNYEGVHGSYHGNDLASHSNQRPPRNRDRRSVFQIDTQRLNLTENYNERIQEQNMGYNSFGNQREPLTVRNRQWRPQGNEGENEGTDHTSDVSIQNRNHYRENRTQYDRRIEKWTIFFSGTARSPSLEDFIYKVKVLASMNGIPRDCLISHIHMLLRDEASNWFFTYYEADWNWEIFETRIRYRFGNTNQDQGNRQQIYDRKQQKGETFIAFVTDIERLNKLLTKSLTSQRKFEIIWENMRQHYRSKLACFRVETLEELIQLNYRIDASDPSLHPIGPKHGVHNIEAEAEAESSDEEEVNLLNRRQHRANGSSSHQDRSAPRGEGASRLPLCWNCRQNGHFWRECKEVKTTFCYVCGNQGKISSSCDAHPRRNQPNQRSESSPNSGN